MAIPISFRHQERKGFAQDLALLVAEKDARAFVPKTNSAQAISEKNGIVHGPHDGGVAFFTGFARLVGLALLMQGPLHLLHGPLDSAPGRDAAECGSAEEDGMDAGPPP